MSYLFVSAINLIGGHEMFETVAKIAGIAGISVLVFLLIARQILSLDIFPMLDRQRAFRVLRYLIFGALLIVAIGALSWLASLALDREGPLIEDVQIGDQNLTQIETECTVLVEEGVVQDVTQLTQEIDCKKSKIRITYWRLGPEAYANLLQGNTTPNLERIFGSKPIVVSNTPASETVESLFQRFGHSAPEVAFSYYDEGNPDEEIYLPSALVTEGDNLPKGMDIGSTYETVPAREISRYQASENVRRIGRIQPIIFPDVVALDTITTTEEWPSDYEMFFSSFGAGDEFYNQSEGLARIIEQTVLWKNFSAQERSRIDALYRQASARSDYRSKTLATLQAVGFLGEDFRWRALQEEALGGGATFSDEELDLAEARFEKRVFQSRLEFFDHLTRSGLPENFIHIYGWAETNVHAGLNTWAFVAPMRQPFVLVAAIEVLGDGDDFAEVTGLHFLREEGQQLRETNTFRRPGLSSFELPWPDYTISSGEKIIVPLRLELRYSREVGHEFATRAFKPDSSVGSAMTRSLSELTSADVIEWDYSGYQPYTDESICCTQDRAPIRKRANAFKPTAIPEIIDSFTYGAALIPDYLMVDGNRVDLREFDPRNVFMMSLFEGGSCPILFAQFPGEETERRIRPMIKSAIGEANQTVDEIRIMGAEEIVLREMELETTFIDKLEVLDTEGNILAQVNEVILKPGEELRFKVPNHAQNAGVRVRLEGYYIPMG